jgi:hypothetical protein
MAKQAGDYKITGTYDDVNYYQMDGQYYARKKSSWKGTRVKKDPRFKRTMQSAHRLGRGSQLASKVYRSLPREEQGRGLFKELKSMAILALKQGKREEELIKLLQQRLEKILVTPAIVKEKKTPVVRTTPSFTKKLFRIGGRKRARVPGQMGRLP